MRERERIIDIGGTSDGKYRIGYSPRFQKIYYLSSVAPYDYRTVGVVLFLVVGEILSHLPVSISVSPVKFFIASTFITLIVSVLFCLGCAYFGEYLNVKLINSDLGKVESLKEDSIRKIKELKQGQFVLAGITIFNVLVIISAYLLAVAYFMMRDDIFLFIYNILIFFLTAGISGYLYLNRAKKYRGVVLKKIEQLEETRTK